VNLRALNTHAVANAGAGIGVAAILSALVALFHFLGDASMLLCLVHEVSQHQFGQCTATLVAAVFALIGAIVIALFCSRYGAPETVNTGGPK
jgi:hypothetical protein